MKLRLRDWLWLILFLSAFVGWGVDRYLAKTPPEKSKLELRLWPEGQEIKTSDAEIQRLETCRLLADLPTDELTNRFKASQVAEQNRRSDIEPILCEMAKRELIAELQAYYSKVAADKSNSWFNRNLPALISLRRAQKKPDPVKMHVEFLDKDWQGNPIFTPEIKAVLENVDFDQQTFTLAEGMDDRSGRRARWKVCLFDEEGTQVADSDFAVRNIFAMGGGIGSCGPLEYGEKGAWHNHMDARNYLAPPKPGIYTLKVFHSEREIADQRDLTGLVLVQSDPIRVRIARPLFSLGDDRISVLPLLALLGLSTVATGIFCIRRRNAGHAIAGNNHRQSQRRRGARLIDLFFLILFVAIALGWFLEHQQQIAKANFKPGDSNADWFWTKLAHE